MFILSVSKKAKDGDVFWKTLKVVVTYVGSHFEENVAKRAAESNQDYNSPTSS